MKQTSIFALLVLFSLTICRGQVKTIEVEKVNLNFATELQFTNWLAKVQFIQTDGIQIYYYKGFRFKIQEDGEIFRTRASLDHTKRAITWISKTGEKSVTSVLTISDKGFALLKKGNDNPVALKIQAR